MCAVALALLGIEGAGCIIMLLPLAWVITAIGSTLGHSLQPGRPSLEFVTRMLVVMLLAVPMFMGAERVAPPPESASPLVVMSYVDIDAPPEVVWRNVIAFPPLPEPDEWVFRAGVAYPIRAEIDGHGPGAVRRCVFSTGSFVEPIRVWDEPHELTFGVSENPPPMREWSPYDIKPPHLDGYLVSEAGQFKLIPLSGGRTRLQGTTWYRQRLWPAAYWQLWSDALIHRIHLRVLRHIKMLSETPPA
jgi:hypothetical protein